MRIDDLAIFGGRPTFDRQLHVGRPNIGDRKVLHERLDDILDRRWLTNDGVYVKEFEERIKGITGVKYTVATCNGTVALEIAIRALNLRGEVIVPSFTFAATAHVLSWLGITPVFCDIGPGTYNINPDVAEQLITEDTSGIIGVHVFGKPCDTEALQKIANRHSLVTLYDAAHAFGCSHDGCMIGNFGDAEVFSFHATKFVNSFEGGAIVTNSREVAHKARLRRNFGFDGYDTVCVGTNGKMSEVAAAMGITSLESMGEIIFVNRCNYVQYQKHLSDVQGIHLMQYDDTAFRNYQYVVIDVDEEMLPAYILVRILRAENVLASRYFYPGCHAMRAYRSMLPALALPETERIASRTVALPTGTAVSENDINAICEVVRFSLERGGEISSEWASREMR